MKPVSQGQVWTATDKQKDTINVRNDSIIATRHHPFETSLKISTADGSISITCNVIKRHNYATQFLKMQKQVLESRGCQRLWCNHAMLSPLWHVGPYYHRIKYCGMSPYNDAAMGQFVDSTCGFYRLLDSLFIMLLT